MKRRTGIRRPANPASTETKLLEELDALLRFQTATFGLTSETEFRALLDSILAAAIEITEADFGSIQLLDHVSGDLQILAQRGLPQDFVHYFNDLPAEEAAFGKAFAKRERVIVHDVETDAAFQYGQSRQIALQSEVRACQSTPLRTSSGRVLGVLSTHYRSSRFPPERGLRLLDLLVRQAADLIERALHGQELESIVSERTNELQEKNLALAMQTEALHELSARLLHAQEAERRRIARDLHDTTAQEIGCIAMTLGHLAQNFGKSGLDTRKVIAENADLARTALQELRTLSYLLYPPFLDELGFCSAVLRYAHGFEKRSGIRVKFDVPKGFPRLSRDLELALFRIVQEALTNVHRYSGSKTAQIELLAAKQTIQLTIEDRGKGMTINAKRPPGEELGVGIPGMRERLRQFGGSLAIESSNRGTRIVASVPLQAAVLADHTDSEAPGEVAAFVPPHADSDSRPKRILIVDDFELSRAGVRTVLQAETDLEVCGEAGSGQEAIRKAIALKPDLIILDLSLPDMGGLTVSNQLRRKGVAARILILTVHSSVFLVNAAQRSKNCEGYVQKALASDELVRAIRTVLKGKTFFPAVPPEAARQRRSFRLKVVE